MQGSKLPEFHQPQPQQIPLGQGMQYKKHHRLPYDFGLCLLEFLLSSLTSDWFLGYPRPRVGNASLFRWGRDLRARLSNRLHKGLDNELQYIVDFVFCDHAKVKIVDLGPEEAIKDLCVRQGAVMAESRRLHHKD